MGEEEVSCWSGVRLRGAWGTAWSLAHALSASRASTREGQDHRRPQEHLLENGMYCFRYVTSRFVFCPDSFCVRRPTRVGWIVAGPSLAGRLHGLGFLFVGELDQVPHYPETTTSPVGISTVPDPSASGRVDMLTSPVAAARAAVATEAWVISKHDMYLIGGTAPIRWRIEKKRIGFGWLS